MAENLNFKDIEGEADDIMDLVQINTSEEKKDIATPFKHQSLNDKSTPSSHATNILKARAIAKESQDNENTGYGASQKAPPHPVSAYVLFIKDLKNQQTGTTEGNKKNFLSDASKAWGSLAPEEKEKFQKAAAKQKQEYQEYIAKQKALGN